jgi:uncharacterized membrane protein YedE/YeeE
MGCKSGICDDRCNSSGIYSISKSKRHPITLFKEKIELPQNHQIDQDLIVGSLIFGIGWGIAGICPAPALTLIGLGYAQALYFIGAMLIGMILHRKIRGV